jgi:ABC-2 type transport system ATP-binding protein
MDAIVAEKLAKRFGNVHALEDVSFKVSKGELFGFLGPNGAGKTTTINILTGLARPDSGTIRIGGIDCTHNPKAAQGLIGVVPDESNLYPELTGFENLCFCASLYGLKKSDRKSRAAELLRSFGLAEAASRKFGGYSKGMKRKLTIAAGIIHSPPILFLDEPTTGIDVASARQIRQLIAGLNRSGTTILLTTHYIEEAERLCARIAFIASGKIIKSDTIENLLQPVKEKHVMEITLSERAKISLENMASAFPNLVLSCPEDDRIRVESGEPVRAGALVRYLEESSHEVMEARRIHPSLEDVFVRITGIEAGAMKKEREKSPS